MPYREGETVAREPSAFVYTPSERGFVGKVTDLALLVFAIATLVLHVRAHEVACAWEGPLARCTWTTTNALGIRTQQTVEGIRSVAFRSGTAVGLVTDAQHKDRDAAFGTRSIDMWDEESALALRAFADDPGSKLALSTGPAHPLLLTLLVLGALAAYAVWTRPPSFALEIDPRERMLALRRRGLFPSVARYDLQAVKDVDVENAAPGLHRVRLVLEDGATRPFTERFYRGERHHAFAREAGRAVRAARGGGTLEDA